MRALTVRDLSVIASHPAFLLAMCVHVAVLAIFLTAWSHGVPQLPGRNAYEQQRLVQWITLAVLLPWTATRCLPHEQRRDVTLLALLTAVRPAHVLLSRVIAIFLALTVLVGSGLPMVILAQQVAGVPLPHALGGLVSMLGLAALASATSVWWNTAYSDPLNAWLASTGTVVGLLVCGTILLPSAVSPWLVWTAALATGVGMIQNADVSMRHLPDEPA